MDPGENVEQRDESTPRTLEQDLLFDLLQNSRRRAVLRMLDEHGESTLAELAELIAAEENEVPPSEAEESARRSVYISLYQRHIPKLADHGVVAYDREESTVELLEPASQLLTHIRLCEDQRDRESPDSKLPHFFRRLFDQ